MVLFVFHLNVARASSGSTTIYRDNVKTKHRITIFHLQNGNKRTKRMKLLFYQQEYLTGGTCNSILFEGLKSGGFFCIMCVPLPNNMLGRIGYIRLSYGVNCSLIRSGIDWMFLILLLPDCQQRPKFLLIKNQIINQNHQSKWCEIVLNILI